MYYGVNAVEKHGTRLGFAGERQPDQRAGHVLVMILDNGLWRIAVDVTDPREYKYHYANYSVGSWVRASLWWLEERLVVECPDEGRVPTAREKA